MRIILCLLSLVCIPLPASAGGHWPCQDAPGGCGIPGRGSGVDMPVVTLSCERGVQVRFREFMTDRGLRLGAQSWLWITYPGQAPQVTAASVSYGDNGTRSFAYADPYCTRNLVELNRIDWRIASSCEGERFTLRCAREQNIAGQ